MSANALRNYQKVSLETASPGHILLRLYDGAIRFCKEASEAIHKGDRARKGERIGKAMAIIGEFASTLDHEKAPELCSRLEQLYFYMQDRLSYANGAMDADAVDEVANLLGTLREAWRDAVKKASQPMP